DRLSPTRPAAPRGTTAAVPATRGLRRGVEGYGAPTHDDVPILGPAALLPEARHARAVDVFFFSSRRRHTRSKRDWSSDVCSSDLTPHSPTAFRSAPAPEPALWRPGTLTGRPHPSTHAPGPGTQIGPRAPASRGGAAEGGDPQFSVTNDTGAGRVADREVNQLVSPMTVKAPTTRARMISHGSSMTPTPVIRSRALRIPRIVPLAVTPPSRMPTPVTAVDSVTAMRTTCHLVRPLSRAAANSPRRSLVAMTTALIAAKSAYRLDIPNNTVKICNWAFC